MATQRFAFGPRNYRLMFVGLAMLAAGFITMTLDTTEYGEGFLGITLGPLLLAAGFVVEFFAIMAKSGNTTETAAPTATAAYTPTTSPTPVAPVAPVEPARPTYKRP
ncbi:DUF3098 domain-containing protein [Hymenobacter lutimineralis]|uniref:DUF3098 domain-containing protein n=1 Tax=Hymenobacter lutimineralis TaxID=2606448 RepID=A0A5D6UZX9_9BACT|nr:MULTISPECIES: DUF3098 domain-containing protein [Hymenobacter]QIX60649.1 DUF3098 domain-containing protein [Hymenobacter sp. BT18]TYZ08710.1 DUF3098 domain-containing protein [Hymenobacter lutimineralis]